MGLDTAVNVFTGKKLTPLSRPDLAVERHVNLAPSTVYPRGQVLAQVAAARADVQTLTIDYTPTGGAVTVSGINPLTGGSVSFSLDYNSSSAAAQTAARAAFGSPNVTVSGGALPGTPLVFTFAGALANMPVPVMTVSSALTGGTPGTVSVAHTTTGATTGTMAKYDGTTVAPAAAPTVSGTGSGSSFAAGTYPVAYTLVTANGESTPSPAAMVTLTAAQQIRVAAISSLNSAVTAVNYYVGGVWAKQTAVSSGTAAQTDMTGASLTTGQSPPAVNTAYTAPNGAGTHIARCLNSYDCATDASGNITLGAAATGGPWGETYPSTPAYFRGDFATADLTGLDAKAVADLGRLHSGTTSNGVLEIG